MAGSDNASRLGAKAVRHLRNDLRWPVSWIFDASGLNMRQLAQSVGIERTQALKIIRCKPSSPTSIRPARSERLEKALAKMWRIRYSELKAWLDEDAGR